MRVVPGVLVASLVAGIVGCAAIAGFEDEYTVGPTGGQGGTGAAGTGTGTAGTGTGTAGTSSGGQGTGGHGVAGAGAGSGENCLDGVDNDGDSLADCSDPDCGGYTCVAEAPSATQYLTTVSAAGDCPADSPAVTLQSCTSCSCNAAGGTCQSSVTFYADSSCSTYVATHNTPWSCVTPNATRWASGFTTPDDDASCTPASAQVASDERPACEISSGGACANAGEVCVPAPSSTAAHCVVVDIGAGCPAPYTMRSPAFVGTPTTCDCSCSAGAQTCPDPVVIASTSTSNCTNTQTYHTGSGCTSVGYAASLQTLAVDGQVDCAASGTTSSVITDTMVCCLP